MRYAALQIGAKYSYNGNIETPMNALSPFCSLDCSCDETLRWIQNQLTQAGLRVMQTFDLHATRARHAVEDCPCPNHGTSACDCQMVVLLVYGKGDNPATLILHGNDGRTWVSFADTPSQPIDVRIQTRIEKILQAIPQK